MPTDATLAETATTTTDKEITELKYTHNGYVCTINAATGAVSSATAA